MSTEDDTERAIRAVERLIKVAPNRRVKNFSNRMMSRLLGQLTALPMSQVIARVPGGSITAKARNIGVSRQTLHYWLDGAMRPDEKHAKTLARLTGLDVAAIRGRADPS